MFILSEILKKSYTKPYAIHCNTQAKANILFELLKKSNVRWYVTGDIADSLKNFWNINKNDTCYVLTDGKLSYTNTKYCCNCGYDIICFNNIADFSIQKKEIKSDIKYKNMLIVCKEKKYVLLKYDGNKYKVQCHEQDKFDWRIGFGLALSQHFGKLPKWEKMREYYRDKEKRELDYKQYALWCVVEFFDNDMEKVEKLGLAIKEIKENGKVDL